MYFHEMPPRPPPLPGTPHRRLPPRSITGAQTALWWQVVCFVCCGIGLPLFWLPGFATVLAFGSSGPSAGGWMTTLVLGGPVIGVVYTVVITRMMRAADPASRPIATAVAFLLTVGTVAAVGLSQAFWYALGAALPWLALQVVAVLCLHSPTAEEWFRSGPPADDAGPER